MKLVTVVNVMDSFAAGATTYRLAADATNLGLMEINVFSPGGLGSAQKFEKVNFTYAVLESLERKVRYMQYYRRNFSNLELATL